VAHYSPALNINNNGKVVGYATTGTGSEFAEDYHGYVWDPVSGIQDVTPGVNRGRVADINDRDIIAGTVGTATGDRAFVGSADNLLGTLPGGSYSRANALNDAGQVVGEANSGGFRLGFLWDGHNMVGLTPTDAFDSAAAHDINAAGLIVGNAWQAHEPWVTSAMLWENGVAHELKDLVVNGDWLVHAALRVNDQGWIAGWGAVDNGDQPTHALLLVPVPEPETWAMLLAGLGLIGLRLSRPNHRHAQTLNH
jgi:probable HAF family extracellular repeat protein